MGSASHVEMIIWPPHRPSHEEERLYDENDVDQMRGAVIDARSAIFLKNRPRSASTQRNAPPGTI